MLEREAIEKPVGLHSCRSENERNCWPRLFPISSTGTSDVRIAGALPGVRPVRVSNASRSITSLSARNGGSAQEVANQNGQLSPPLWSQQAIHVFRWTFEMYSAATFTLPPINCQIWLPFQLLGTRQKKGRNQCYRKVLVERQVRCEHAQNITLISSIYLDPNWILHPDSLCLKAKLLLPLYWTTCTKRTVSENQKSVQ